MDRSNVITLLSATKTQDQFGVWRETLAERNVFCQVDSVTANEFFNGGRNGLNPEYRMTMFFGDYHGETMLQYNGMTYAIYRTYQRRDDIIELYVERKGGTNGKEGDD
jgi:hypothetical protein